MFKIEKRVKKQELSNTGSDSAKWYRFLEGNLIMP